ncbi:MAG: TIR domain-containing protein, partial [Oscillospiraceae bacterium]|nr:TIR domain-containing protein [Oscillospiraceae bacterium]
VFDDDNYKSALHYADGYQKEIYEEEAKTINEIQKGILAISEKEEPFDVFICYKETDASGRRTPDSVLATELYHQLTQEGFKVFFSRITLEDKLGVEYEPYIFAALNSAKVMVVLGTKPEYFNAAWVKNEWSRYLALIRKGAKKVLVPAYKDMDPYDLPEEFSHLQAQDMSRLGFMQDLIRGIGKIAAKDEQKSPAIINGAGSAGTASLMRRAFMFLEDGEWESADEYCEKVLDIEPENAEAYIGKMMAELHVKKREELALLEVPFSGNANYKKAVRFANPEIEFELEEYLSEIRKRGETKQYDEIYSKGIAAMRTAKTEKDFIKAAESFGSIPEYKDSLELENECRSKAKKIKEENEIKAEERRKAAEIRKKKNKKIAAILLPIVALITAAAIVYVTVVQPMMNYNAVLSIMEEGRYEEAIAGFEAMNGYKDSEEHISECKYCIASGLVDEKKYEEAIAAFKEIEEYKNSKELIIKCSDAIKEDIYQKALSLMDEGKNDEAIDAFGNIKDYKDSTELIAKCEENIKEEKYLAAAALFEKGEYEAAISAFEEIKDYKDSAEQIETIKKEQKYQEALALMNAGKYKKAKEAFEEIKDYKDSAQKIKTCNNKINASSSSTSSSSSSSSGSTTSRHEGVNRGFTVVCTNFNNDIGTYEVHCNNCGKVVGAYMIDHLIAGYGNRFSVSCSCGNKGSVVI